MSFPNVSEEMFRQIMSENFTPSATIKTPERLFGRDAALKTIDRTFSSQGRQIFIFGDRGVGKTSVAQTAAFLQNSSKYSPIYVVCNQGSTFGSVVKAIGDSLTDIRKRIEQGGTSSAYGANLLGVGGSLKKGEAPRATINEPSTINEALDIIRYVQSVRADKQVVIIDEMERITDVREKEKFAELIKNIPEVGDGIRFIFCGIASTLNELIGAHPSAGRVLETINLPKLHHNYLWDIINHTAEKIGIAIDRELLVRVGQISDGFPHYVHLIGESMFWSAFDDASPAESLQSKHYKDGIEGAISRAEATLKLQYERATMKTKNTEDYEEALWSLADTTSERRQLTEIYEASYKRIMSARRGRQILTREKFNQRMLALRKDGHGSVIIGYGSGWFGFRENIIRGYVRLRAERQNVALGRDVR
ncbi:ATP-binding protein [Metarhizobium album]|nr:ATP-binding protein [Rhizobium album]